MLTSESVVPTRVAVIFIHVQFFWLQWQIEKKNGFMNKVKSNDVKNMYGSLIRG